MAITALVHDAYVGSVALLGRQPMPMTVDYAEAVALHEVWVLDEGDRLSGVLELIAKPDVMWIENVAVAPDRQGRGLGRRLLAHAEAQARERGLTAMGLLTNERYVENIAMYERHGYRETARAPRGRPFVPTTTSRTVCAPLVVQPHDHATARYRVVDAFRSSVLT